MSINERRSLTLLGLTIVLDLLTAAIVWNLTHPPFAVWLPLCFVIGFAYGVALAKAERLER